MTVPSSWHSPAKGWASFTNASQGGVSPKATHLHEHGGAGDTGGGGGVGGGDGGGGGTEGGACPPHAAGASGGL